MYQRVILILIFAIHFSIAKATVAYMGAANYSQITESSSEVII